MVRFALWTVVGIALLPVALVAIPVAALVRVFAGPMKPDDETP